jgi:queuine tRNA-ribosyltransferase
MRFVFALDARSELARAGRITTSRGSVETPAFMPVATQASVKSLAPDEVAASGARLVIMNTYHLWLRPGAELIAAHGGLHAFSRWSHLIATDSGGFQAFSLAERTRLDEDGFDFASHLDGTRHRLTPEESMRIQGLLGSDVALQLDVCPAAGTPRVDLVRAVERTTRWAERCLRARVAGQALFGIVQGGTDVELRLAHSEKLAKLPFEGLALGGFSVGEPKVEMRRTLARVAPALDAARPRYLMGVGTPADILHAIGVGIDMFDCVLPTRNARNGQVFVAEGKLVLKNAMFRDDARPLDESCGCPACAGGFSRAYLRHLYASGEILAHRLLTLHNLFFYAALVREARAAIVRGEYARWSKAALERLGDAASDADEADRPLPVDGKNVE